jgi:hypothetical protein
MKSIANKTLIDRPPDGRVRVLDLRLFAGFMSLAARVLYCLDTDHDIVRTRARLRCASGVNIGAKRGLVSGFDCMPPSLCSLDVSRILRTREHLMTRVQLAPPSPALFNQ